MGFIDAHQEEGGDSEVVGTMAVGVFERHVTIPFRFEVISAPDNPKR
jgi:hypothetical protein